MKGQHMKSMVIDSWHSVRFFRVLAWCMDNIIVIVISTEYLNRIVRNALRWLYNVKIFMNQSFYI